MKILTKLELFDVKLLDYIIDVEIEQSNGSVTTSRVDMRGSLVSLYYMLVHLIVSNKLKRDFCWTILLPTFIIIKMLRSEKSIVIIDSLIENGFLDELLLFSATLPKRVERMTMDELTDYSKVNTNTIEFFQEAIELIDDYLVNQTKDHLLRLGDN